MSLVVVAKPLQFCMQAIESLDKHPAAPKNVIQGASVLDRLLQADNKAGWKKLSEVNFDGKPAPDGTVSGPRLYMEYEKPYCPGGVSSCATSVCDVDDATAEQTGYLELAIDKCAERNFSIDVAEFNSLCETPSQRMADILRRKAYEIKMEINNDAINQLYVILNNYVDGDPSIGVTAKLATIINPEGNIIPAGLVKLNREYLQANYPGDKIIFGGTTLADYFVTKMYQGAGANGTGIVDPFTNMPFIYDNQFDAIFQTLEADTDSHGVTLPVGALHVQEWYENTGYQKLNLETRISQTMEIDGMKFDYDMKFDDCDKKWKIQLRKKYGFASIPAATYCDGQGLVFHWKFACGDFGCAAL